MLLGMKEINTNDFELVSENRLSKRLIDLEFKTGALTENPHCYVLVPAEYETTGNKQYPVIYFLHGGSAGPTTGLEYKNWIEAGHVDEATNNMEVICVMPEGSTGGWYSDWFNSGSYGKPMWETFHIKQLLGFIDSKFRTINERNKRAIVGVSMGGFGAMKYAAKFPDLFGACASLSGALNLVEPPSAVGPLSSLIVGAMAKGAGGDPEGPFGNFENNMIIWRGNNPFNLIANLRNTEIFLYCGNGRPGPLDADPVDPFSITIEKTVYMATLSFAQELTKQDISFYFDDYGNATHNWLYWNAKLKDLLPRIQNVFKMPPKLCDTINYKSIESNYSCYGWHIRIERDEVGFSQIIDASKNGFEFEGFGKVSVITPAFYNPKAKYVVELSVNGFPKSRELIESDMHGSLYITFELPVRSPTSLEQSIVKLSTAKVSVKPGLPDGGFK
jgi:S-formylglutathione hydrolase FrmB